MKIIYHCFGGTHSSVTATAAHLGMLPPNQQPCTADLLAIPFFDTRESDDHGDIKMMGIDECGNEVYFVGQRGAPQILENLIYGLGKYFEIPPEEYKLINVMHKVNVTMKIGGTMSRQLGWINAGRPIVTWGTIRAYKKIISLVRKIKAGESR